MKTSPASKIESFAMIFTVALILFWLYVAGAQLSDFERFTGEMINQVFSRNVSKLLAYTLPFLEIGIAGLLVFSLTRIWGMFLGFMLMLGFSIYVGLALLNVYERMPCNCAGLLGHNTSWSDNLIFNLLVLAVALLGLIFTYKDKERRKKGMDTIVSHAPLTA